jgi:putative two-component system response regulator
MTSSSPTHTPTTSAPPVRLEIALPTEAPSVSTRPLGPETLSTPRVPNLPLSPNAIRALNILVVDDEPSTSLMVRKLLIGSGYPNVMTESDSRRAFELIRGELPALVLLDIRMPHVTGLGVLEQLRGCDDTKQVPVVVLTSDTDSQTKIKALSLGASDFLHKPVNASELIARVTNTLLAKAHLDSLASYSSWLEQEVNARTAELAASRREAIACLARASEMRDDVTGNHVLRVGKYTAIIADELGFERERVDWIELAAQLHDVGKIGVPDSILKKTGKLTAEEYELMKRHCLSGSRVICNVQTDEKGTKDPYDHKYVSPLMRMAAVIASTHHEKWDGSGYPRGLVGEQIPIEGRIVAVADVFDALSSQRPYKPAFDLDHCFKILEEDSGIHFDPQVVAAFLRRTQDVIAIYERLSDKTL